MQIYNIILDATHPFLNKDRTSKEIDNFLQLIKKGCEFYKAHPLE